MKYIKKILITSIIISVICVGGYFIYSGIQKERNTNQEIFDAYIQTIYDTQEIKPTDIWEIKNKYNQELNLYKFLEGSINDYKYKDSVLTLNIININGNEDVEKINIDNIYIVNIEKKSYSKLLYSNEDGIVIDNNERAEIKGKTIFTMTNSNSNSNGSESTKAFIITDVNSNKKSEKNREDNELIKDIIVSD